MRTFIVAFWVFLFLDSGQSAQSSKRFHLEAGGVFSDIYTAKKPEGTYKTDSTAQIGATVRFWLSSVFSTSPFMSIPITSGKDGAASTRTYLYAGSPFNFHLVEFGKLEGCLHFGPAMLFYSSIGPSTQVSRAWSIDIGADINYDRFKLSVHTLMQQALSAFSRNINLLITFGVGL